MRGLSNQFKSLTHLQYIHINLKNYIKKSHSNKLRIIKATNSIYTPIHLLILVLIYVFRYPMGKIIFPSVSRTNRLTYFQLLEVSMIYDVLNLT